MEWIHILKTHELYVMRTLISNIYVSCNFLPHDGANGPQHVGHNNNNINNIVTKLLQVYSVGLFNNWLIHKNCTTYYFVCSENTMQIKQNFFTMERAFLSQETFTVSQLHMYDKPACSVSSRFLSRSGLCVLFDYWTDKFKNKDAHFIHLLLPHNMSFFLYLKYRAPYLLLLKTAWNNILTQNGQIQEKKAKLLHK